MREWVRVNLTKDDGGQELSSWSILTAFVTTYHEHDAPDPNNDATKKQLKRIIDEEARAADGDEKHPWRLGWHAGAFEALDDVESGHIVTLGESKQKTRRWLNLCRRT